MIIKLKIKGEKKTKKKQIDVWIQRHEDIENDVQQLFQFFKDQMTITKTRRILPYYRVSSKKPAIMLSFVTALQEIIPEIYFSNEDSVDFEESINS
ncbi:MAG: hypothetical protein KGD73_05990 [Candidatus Lokiarchaeota archaeon]|nr:hypothetical protein [Candidatus Lokiarchaeota archaeon]